MGRDDDDRLEQSHPRRRAADRDFDPDDTQRVRSPQQQKPTAWQDPRTWMQLISILLGLFIFVVGYAASKLSSIDTALQMIREDKATKTEQISQMQKQIDKSDADQAKKWADQNAYNYDQMKMLTEIRTKLGMEKQRDKP